MPENLSRKDIEAHLPNLEQLTDKLAYYSGKSGFEIVTEDVHGNTYGNHGDALMYSVFEKVLETMSVTQVDDVSNADFLFVRPNGALLESYQFPRVLEKRLAELPDLPLVIFPSSALFPKQDPSFMFKDRRSPVLWVFREKFSFDHIEQKWGSALSAHNVELFLTHDVVALGHKFVPAIIATPLRAKQNLLAGRIDSESKKDFSPVSSPKLNTVNKLLLPLKKFVAARIVENPSFPLSRLIAGAVYRKRLRAAADTLFDSLPTEVQSEISNSELPTMKVDLSSQLFVTFDEYAKSIREANIVVTDRLHVALPAAIVGKRVYLVEAGYHKLTGVYNQSLSQLENVTLINAYSAK